ncbi:hypothetical protein SAMN06272739_4326 [Blastococcus haudaquaticus]|uniref:Catalytic LigB subunit of aromatic ring-opening dioxygenase n=1 Tax=Blastococcus haudaquaticus TaxID=1938745 RepID=A0A286H7H9_9ACTN|nr:hypothetical protein SAMN06272739_4326 [Blastococcus haudaquaticus]
MAVAFCPAPPLLLPAVEVRAAADTRALRAACAAAVTDLLAVRPEVVVVVGTGAAPGERFGTGDVGCLHGFGIAVELPFDGRVRPGGKHVPVPHALGASLLDQAGFAGVRVGVGPDDLAQLVRDLPAPVGVLAMGDGSARRTMKAPGYLDEAAAPFDAAVADALSSGDANALAGLDVDEGERLLADGVPVWRAVGAALSGGRITARLHHDAAPFGVGYLAASWVAA